MKHGLMEEAMNDMAVIRTTFETMDLFVAEDPIRAEMFAVVFDARNNLVRRSILSAGDSRRVRWIIDWITSSSRRMRFG